MTESGSTPTIKDLIAAIRDSRLVKGELSDRLIRHARRTSDADADSVAFVDRDRRDKHEMVAACRAGLLLCDVEDVDPKANQVIVVLSNPKLAFAELVSMFWADKELPGIHPSAVIHPEARIDPSATLGALCVVGRSSIGAGCVVAPGVIIYDGVTIGSRVRIASGTVIGAAGFGYIHDDEGRVINFPHIAGVTIEDDVEIGANTTIDRGALSDTILKEGCKVDNLVHVAHNVVIGANAMIIANTMIGGSTVIGDGAYVAPSATLRDVITIGAGATVGLAAVVTKSIPDGQTWTGSPAVPLQEFSAQRAKLKKLLD